MKKLILSSSKNTPKDAKNLHAALKKLKLKVDVEERNASVIGTSSKKAIKDFQEKLNLDATGRLNKKTVHKINEELFDAFYLNSKTRIKKLHEQFERLGIEVDKEEKNRRHLGNSTRKAITKISKRAGLDISNGKLSEPFIEKLENEVIKKRYSTKNQIGKLHKQLNSALKIGKIDSAIGANELKNKRLGNSTSSALKAFQKKYNLEPTGKLDKNTLERLNSVASSRGKTVKLMSKPPKQEITKVSNNLRLNKTSMQVANLQKVLSNLGYPIALKEHNTSTFGKTTMEAVKMFQSSKGMHADGKVEHLTGLKLNEEIKKLNPEALAEALGTYEVKGSVRDENLNRIGNMVIKVYERNLDGSLSTPLISKKNHRSGFFHLKYQPPIDSLTGQIKNNFHLEVKLFDDQNNEIDSRIIYNVARIQWVNFNLADEPYKGTPLYFKLLSNLSKALNGTSLDTIKETEANRQITFLSKESGIPKETIMRMVFSELVSKDLDNPKLTPEVVFAFIKQNYPPKLPNNLLTASLFWEHIDALVEEASSGLVFSDEDSISEVIDSAIVENLVSISIKHDKQAIIDTILNTKTSFTLEKPILVGNGNLKSILDQSSISQAHYNTVSTSFINHNGTSKEFWTELETSGISQNDLKDLKIATTFASITKSHTPTIVLLKGMLSDPANTTIKQSSDVAKLNKTQWIQLISDNGQQVPENMPGDTIEEKVANFAVSLETNSSRNFPAISAVDRIKQLGNHNLNQIDNVESFVDFIKDEDFKRLNVDKFLIDEEATLSNAGFTFDDTLKDEIKVVQRIHKLTSNSDAAAAMAAESLHSSYQIYRNGKNNFVSKLVKHNIPVNTATKIFEKAKSQYSMVLARYLEFRPELHRHMPSVIQNWDYNSTEIQTLVGEIPNLEELFGSLDTCSCEHCKSLYGPAAYFTDLLRFLGEHQSLVEEDGNTLSVQEILLNRRPDLAHIKLNCQNTNTPMPYIDLVCEILENAIEPLQSDFSHQTTLSQVELGAIPEYIRPHAYELLATSDYPMNSSFNLWQEEIRLNLEHFKIPRWKLMEVFQNTSDTTDLKPDEFSIAAEYLKISTHELSMIVNQNQGNAAEQNKIWGWTDTSQPSISVEDFLDRAKITYEELIELTMLSFINDNSMPLPLTINRPLSSCDLGLQRIENMSPKRLDRIHRFLRLWRKSSLAMWDLSLFLVNPKIGDPSLEDGEQVIDKNTILKLKQFKQLQNKIDLPVDILLAFYGNINTVSRLKPDNPNITLSSLYEKLFQNVSVTNPIDVNFKLSQLNGTIVLSKDPVTQYTPVPTILSALSLSKEDFDKIIEMTGETTLNLESLSALLRYSYLAKGLGESITNLNSFYLLSQISDPFESLEITLNTIEQLELIKESGMAIIDLDYILRFDPDSVKGIRLDTITQYLEAIRNLLEKKQELVETLNLTVEQKEVISSFDTAVLVGDAPTDALSKISTLKATLNAVSENFNEAFFVVDEINYCLAFDANDNFSVELLIQMINAIQSQLNDALGNANNQIIALCASIFDINEMEMAKILDTISAPGSSNSLLEILSDKTILAKDTESNYKPLSEANFKSHFDSLNLLHKISVLHSNITFQTEELEWFIAHHNEFKTLDYGSLPVVDTMASASFKDWINLFKFYRFASYYPKPEYSSLKKILELTIKTNPNIADINDIADLISKFTQWDIDAVKLLIEGFGFKHTNVTQDLRNVENYDRMKNAMVLSKRVGVEIDTVFSWSSRDNLVQQKQIALETKNAIKSKYDSAIWYDKISPVQNLLRTAKRSALLAYHLDHSQRTQSANITLDSGKKILNPMYWKDSNALYKYFLIDVEMGPDQLSSRIKQAISSVQFFVQRCFLNLEQLYVQVSQEDKQDVSSENSWRQWKWMKNYRIWEANRKVFFYPENWIEPELRDDKSPFFKELEEELLQGEVTHDNVEVLFRNYIHKVDTVSNLTVCGLYHEYDDWNEEVDEFAINKVHVIAKTKDQPGEYYYRIFDMNYSTWTAWEKIDVDITGDHAIPVVYNRKLHIFWLTFVEKPQRTRKIPAAQASSGPTDAPEPQKMLEIQLGWTVRKHNGWTPKQISNLKLIHPWERPHFSYHLKPFYKAYNNELWLDIYISTSKEFNDRLFYDPYWSSVGNKYAKVTHIDYNETFRPWHSSSFIFDGKVKEVKMNALKGQYRLITKKKPKGTSLFNTDSVTYVRANYSEDGRQISKFGAFDDGPKIDLPNGMHFHNNHLRNNQSHNINNNKLNVLSNGATKTLFRSANSPFDLTVDLQDIPLDSLNTDHPMFYQDRRRVLFIKPEWQKIFDEYDNLIGKTRYYKTSSFYHPYAALFLRELNRDGLDGLLTRSIQVKPSTYAPGNNLNFNMEYLPTASVKVDKNVKTDTVDFSFSGAYSIYNWEIFFHAPLMIANRLMQNQRFEEAMRWFHYIFDPTNVESKLTPQRFWITKPFFEHNQDDYRKQRIENILSNLDIEEVEEQLVAWRNNPFMPHLIARYRPVAYQKNVVMKYLDNLIAWGDQLFRQDTMESINEAALLYMLADEILGDRPKEITNVEHVDLSFNELPNLDEIGNSEIDIHIEDTLWPVKIGGQTGDSEPLPNLETIYFGIPANDFILKYWDTVEDRMFKIRNSMNIDGVKRTLSLFAPPIDPALLVKAAAAGIDLATVLNDISVGTPHYKFRIIHQKAVEFCNDVKQLGDKLLSALEKKDAEELSLLRSQHEIQLLKGIKLIKEHQIDEAVESLAGLQQSLLMAQAKDEYYGNREFMNTQEIISFSLNTASTTLDAAIAAGYALSGGLKLIPNFVLGGSGIATPTVNAETGGTSFGDSAEDLVKTISSISNALQKGAGLAGTQGSYQRRMDDWKHQQNLATTEIEQIQFQINAAMIRQSIAERDLRNQEEQIENSEEVLNYMKNKYTNQQLYNWMISQISSAYFQSYQLAYEMAKKAERCYQYEIGVENSSIIKFGYWDSLKKGLMSGEKLLQDLRSLEASYLDKNKRQLEITKHISLAQVSPLSLINLKQNGECTLTLPEWLFDMDYPGHYMRRIKSVSISIPCITGPYTSVNCTLSLTRHELRVNSEVEIDNDNYHKQDADDQRFRTRYGAISSISTSHGQADNGMFELNFNDERYLPFEGAGLDSNWLLQMPVENNHFDFSSISDVIIHINYTARNGGNLLANEARKYVDSVVPKQSHKLFSLKHEYSNEWYKMLNPVNGEDQVFDITLREEHYPYFMRGKLSTWKIQKIHWFIDTSDSDDFVLQTDIMTGNFSELNNPIIHDDTFGLHSTVQALQLNTNAALGRFRFKIRKSNTNDFKSLSNEAIKNIFIAFEVGIHEPN